jgi:ketosteroid isomerase-like protein
MERDALERWLGAYVAAWKSYDRDEIGALFSEDCVYRYHPFDEPVRGREEIVESWFDEPDEPGSYDATYAPAAVEGDIAVATGTSTYTNADGSIRAVYDNCFVMRFDADGLCAEFTEWFIERPAE